MTPLTTSQWEASEDTEITLGTGKMLALFFGLVVLCALFFGMGFSMGKNSVRTAPELLPSPNPSTATRPAAVNHPPTAPAPESKPAETQSSTAGASPGTPTSTLPTQPSAPELVQPGTGYFVQVAAVSKQEDAEALVEALKGRQYSAFIANPSPDKLFHVQIGPFADPKEAESTRAKLMNDGYNPILKK
jgi:cell division septation protein DedD